MTPPRHKLNLDDEDLEISRVYNCPVSREWQQHRSEVKSMSLIVNQLASDTKHLQKLDALEPMKEALAEMVTHTLGAATGRKQVPISVCLLVCAVLGVSLILIILDKTEKTVRIGGPGGVIEIVSPGETKITSPVKENTAR